MLIGEPISQVKYDECGWRQPHGPSVNVVAELIDGRVDPIVVHLKKCTKKA